MRRYACVIIQEPDHTWADVLKGERTALSRGVFLRTPDLYPLPLHLAETEKEEQHMAEERKAEAAFLKKQHEQRAAKQ